MHEQKELVELCMTHSIFRNVRWYSRERVFQNCANYFRRQEIEGNIVPNTLHVEVPKGAIRKADSVVEYLEDD